MERDGKGPGDDAPTLSDGSDASSVPTLSGPWSNDAAGTPPSWAIGRYQLSDVLGRGGMGEVISARDDEIGRSVAIKRLRADNPSPIAITRFLREARIQGRLEHPAVVPVHELRKDEHGRPVFVMKQLTGVTLADVVKKLARGDGDAAKRFGRQRLLRAFVEVCLAVEFAHTCGVVHRDLKPANIVLGDFGEVYVLDWGIAHVIGGATAFADIDTIDERAIDGMVLGSPGYMSPEQIRLDAGLDGRSDVYALGCILFEILTHEALHEPGLAGVALALTGVEARPSVRTPDRDVPPELEAIVLAATMLDRRDRYGTARELGDAVQAFLDGDRDVALRKDLARKELIKAHAALARGEGAGQRKIAIRSAARALALDPTNEAPADFVGRLMLEPPTEVPPEVEEAVARVDDDALFNARRLIVQAAIAYLAFFPVVYLIGFRHPLFIAAGVAVAIAMAALALTATRERVHVVAYTALVGNALMTGLFAWAATPFLIAPSLAVITAMSLATHPRLSRGFLLVGVVIASVLTPFVLEVAGVLPRSMSVTGDAITLHTAGTGMDDRLVSLALVAYVIALLWNAVSLAKSLTNQRRAAQRMVQIQSWQLAQLVPSASENG